MSSDVLCAMQARGFRGSVVLLEDLRMAATDWWQLSCFAGVAGLAMWLGR